jgi:tetratricopeptide (TPR) repeat protein
MRRLAGLCALAALALVTSGCATAGPSQPPPDPAATQAALWRAAVAGRYAEQRQEPGRGAVYYERALAAFPQREALRGRAIEERVSNGDVATAAALARGVAGTPEGLAALALAADLAGKGQWAKAKAAVDGRRFGQAADIAARFTEAWALVAQGKREEAIAASSIAPGLPILRRIVRVQQASLLASLGRSEEALALYRQAWEEGARFAVGLDAYGALLERTGAASAALTLYDSFLADQPDNPTISLARSRLVSGERAPAPETPAQGLARVYFALGAAIAAQGDARDSLAYLQIAVRLDPDLEAARATLGDALALAGRTRDALRTYASVAPQSPYFATARADMAYLLQQEGRPQDALALLDAAHAQTGARRLLLARGDVLRAERRYGEAEAVFDQVVRAAAQDARAADWRLYFARGALRERTGRWEEAERDLKRALELSPDQPDVANYLAYTWVEMGVNTQQALDMLRRAVAQRPRSGAIVDSLGWALFKLGRYDEALGYLERAIALSPGDFEINDHLGDLYWRLGREREARFQWARALTLDPSDEDRLQITQKLERGLPPKTGSASAHVAHVGR